MKTKAVHSSTDTHCMYCGNFIPAGMTFRQVYNDQGFLIGDRCYQKCPAIKKTVLVFEGEELEFKEIEKKESGTKRITKSKMLTARNAK